MKSKTHLTLLCALGLSLIQTPALAQLNNNEQKASYSIGVDLANNLKDQGLELDVDAFLMGLEDRLKEKSLKLSQEQRAQAISEFTKTLEAKQSQRHQALAQENLKRGQAFLVENKNKPGIQTLDSGLQYRVIESGEGTSPTEQDLIIAHYRGKLIDGTEFDSSYSRGTPIEFKMTNVIPGWQQALKRMKPGAKWEIFVPADLAYGERGAGGVIGPNEVLIFDIHFIITGVE